MGFKVLSKERLESAKLKKGLIFNFLIKTLIKFKE